MAEFSRQERNRELIEKSSALLAADYPVDVLMERLCSAISAAFDATCFVALPNEDGSVVVTSASSRGARITTERELLPVDSPIAHVMSGGRPSLMRTRADWGGDEPPGVVAAAYVPARHGERILGVLGVQHPQPEHFDRDDLRLLEAVARYLAMAIRSQGPPGLSAVPIRYPWFGVVTIVVLALLGSFGAGLWAHNRADEVYSRAAIAHHGRLSRLSSVLTPSLEDGSRYARLASNLVGPVQGDSTLTQTLLIRLLKTTPREIFGIGVFYAPFAFDTGTQWYGPYYHRTTTGIDATHGVPQYDGRVWYTLATRAHGAVIYTDPYTGQGQGFVSAAQAFYQQGHLRGVALVDFLTTSINSALRSAIRPGDWAYITDSQGRRIISSGPPLSGEIRDEAMPLGSSRWSVHLAVSYANVVNEGRQTVAWGIGLALSIWAIALAVFGFLNVTYHARRDALGLKLQRAELQSEIATRIDAEERLRSAAYHDALTGLPNRAFFHDQLAEVVNQPTHGEYAVLFIDLDRFYVVNDIMGHSIGDAVLRAIAERFEEILPPHALIARLGGDEFVLLLATEGPAVREAVAIAEDLLEALRNPFLIEGREVFSNASIGIVRVDESHDDPETVLRDADISMYHAKRAGRAGYAIFDRTMRDRVKHQLELEGGLRGAVERAEFVAHYQPIVRISDGTVVGFEALARWDRDGNGDFVSASEFISVAEQTGMLRAIDADLFVQVCRDARELLRVNPGLRFSINVSATDLTRPSLLADMDATMQRFDLTPKSFKIEITETAVMEDAERALAMLGELRSCGFEITVDDFGVGYSSLSYLQRLPIGGVKIDRSFIVSLPRDGQALEIARAIVALAKTLGLTVTAEGVERRDQAEVLAAMGVDFAQGFWYSAAVDFERAQSFLHESRKALV